MESPALDEEYGAGDTSDLVLDCGGTVSFTQSFVYLGSHCFIATYQIIMTWMFESRKPLSSLVRYVTIFSVLARCLSGSKGRSTLVVFLRCCCMFASRGASRLSPSLACATGITSAYMKCAE